MRLQNATNDFLPHPTNQIIKQLSEGVPLIVRNKKLTPNPSRDYSVGDLITGYGVSEAILHYYSIRWANHELYL